MRYRHWHVYSYISNLNNPDNPDIYIHFYDNPGGHRYTMRLVSKSLNPPDGSNKADSKDSEPKLPLHGVDNTSGSGSSAVSSITGGAGGGHVIRALVSKGVYSHLCASLFRLDPQNMFNTPISQEFTHVLLGLILQLSNDPEAQSLATVYTLRQGFIRATKGYQCYQGYQGY